MFFCKYPTKTKFHSLLRNSLLRCKNNQKRFGVYDVYFTMKDPIVHIVYHIHVRQRHSKAKQKYYKNNEIK